MSSENRFFEEVKGRLDNYTPEAPAEIFGAARSQFLVRRFFRFNLQHFNVWYAGVLITGITAAVMLSDSNSQPEPEVTSPIVIQTSPSVQTSEPIQMAEPAKELPTPNVPETKKKKQVAESEASVVIPVESIVVEDKEEKDEPVVPETDTRKSKSLNVKVLKNKE